MTHSCDSPKNFVVLLAGESLFISIGQFTATDLKRVVSIRLSLTWKPVWPAGATQHESVTWSGTILEARQAFDQLFDH